MHRRLLNLYLQLSLGMLWPFSYPGWVLLLAHARAFGLRLFVTLLNAANITQPRFQHAIPRGIPRIGSQSDCENSSGYAILFEIHAGGGGGFCVPLR